MKSILDIIAEGTNGKSFKTRKYEFEGIEMPRFDYDDHPYRIEWTRMGETDRSSKVRNLKEKADCISRSQPLFKYFLDGSRRTYKVDDIVYRKQVYPIIAGQVGVGCCVRENREMRPLYCDNEPMFERKLVITLPQLAKNSDWVSDDVYFGDLLQKINKQLQLEKDKKTIRFDEIITYPTNISKDEKIENKGIAKIQDYMVRREKNMVAELVKRKKLSEKRYLLKDGSLEYQVIDMSEKELRKYRNNYRYVVGASKSFNPAMCVVKNQENISSQIAELPVYYRTPVQMYYSERIGDMRFAVWFVRIRSPKYTSNAFDGVLKLEKILVTDQEIEEGIDSDEVDVITGNIINERNPVCYGADSRWANHLYPVYATERFVKSRYLGYTMFLNLF